MNMRPDNFDEDEGSRDFIENNINASVPFQYPDFDEPLPRPKSFDNCFLQELWKWILALSDQRAEIIATLPDDQRNVYLLHRRYHKTFREIATTFGHSDHKWALRRYNAAVAAIEKGMVSPHGAQKSPAFFGFLRETTPHPPSNRKGKHAKCLDCGGKFELKR